MTFPSGPPEQSEEFLDDAVDVLHSFAVVARFRREAGDAHEAEVLVRGELRAVQDQYDQAKVEPQEPDGRWAVDVRFVVASLDGESARDGVHRALSEAAATPDEVWLAQELA